MKESEPAVVLQIRSWLLLSHLFVLVLPVVALLGTGALARDLWRQTQEDINHQATLWRLGLEAELEEHPDWGIQDAASRLAPRMAAARLETLAGVRVTSADGRVVSSSAGTGIGEDVSDDQEVQTALAGAAGADVRPRGRVMEAPLSSVSRRSNVRVYVAQPVRRNGEVVGAVLISRTPREEFQTLYQMAPQLSVGGGLALLIAVAVAYAYGRRFSRSLHALADTSQRIASGETDTSDALAPALMSHVSETRVLAQAMETMRRRLTERMRYISEFAANVSHEFKTPVTTLRGTLELLRDDEELPPEQRLRFLDNALADLDRLNRMIGGLLALARAEEGGGRELLDLDGLIHSACDRYSINTCIGKAGSIIGNTGQLDAVLQNLLQNARRYGAEPITVEAWVEGAFTGFTVTDHGPGISVANQSRIFDRFFTTSRASGGTGLGLALVRTVCVAHGGNVTVESEPGKTSFRVSLPRVR